MRSALPYNGSGTYTAPANSWNPAVGGTTIDSADWNSTQSDYETAFSSVITKDGQTTITANLPMSGFKHTGVNTNSGSTSRSEYASGATAQDNVTQDAGVTAGSSTVYTATLSPAISAYTDKASYRVQIDETCGANPTINFNSVGAKKLYKNVAGVATQLSAGDLAANFVAILRYDAALDAAAGGFWVINLAVIGTGVVDWANLTQTIFNQTAVAPAVLDKVPFADASDSGNRKVATLETMLGLVAGHIDGLALTNNGSDPSNDIDIAVGGASDNTNFVLLRLASALTKRIDATWAVGTNQGGLDTGVKANNTIYYIWLIERSDTGVVDALFSTSDTAPTMPANYDRKALIGATRTDGSANIRASYFMRVLPGGHRSFVSDNQSIPGASTVADVPHALGGEPMQVQIWFVCTTASQGYSIGDKFLAFMFQDSSNQNYATRVDSTNVTFATSSSGTILVQNKTAFTQVAMTTTNFRFIVKATI